MPPAVNRRKFLQKLSLITGAGVIIPASAMEFINIPQAQVNGEIIRIPSGPSLEPLSELTIETVVPGKIQILDGTNNLYFTSEKGNRFTVIIGGALGFHLVIFYDANNRPADFATFKVDCKTSISDDKGKYSRLLDNLYYSMIIEWEREASVVQYNQKYYHLLVGWLRDHVHTLKGMKYFYPELTSGIDLYGDSQREDGMIWDNYGPHPEGPSYWEQRFDYGGFYRSTNDNKNEFNRIPVEADVEYLFIEGIYFTWKATGNHLWMKGMLDKALKALKYSTASPLRWSEKYNLIKRGYTIDTWDFQNDEDADISTGPGNAPDPMVIKEEFTRFGIMFGDNTGMMASCGYLEEMLRFSGRDFEADKVAAMRRSIETNLNQISWNGNYYTHHVPEDPGIKRDLGVEEKSQMSLSNAYSLNRGISAEKKSAIIESYLKLKSQLPEKSPGEWYTIYPPFEKGYGSHNSKWTYMNGGVTSIVAGELAHGAYESGFEAYGTDILNRILALSEKTGGHLHCTYRGYMPPNPERKFVTLDIRKFANADIAGKTLNGVPGWTGEGENDLHEFPVNNKSFLDIPFDTIDPETNTRKACLGLSAAPGYSNEVKISLKQKTKSLYILHTTGKNYYAGSLTLNYKDGSNFVDHIGPGKITNWWYPSESQDRKSNPVMRVAWTGKNKFSRSVGVTVYGINNPFPDKEIESLKLTGPGDPNKWMVLGITLSDYEVFFQPDFISTGIPDNWGAAAVVYALVEGLCGVKDMGTAFDKLILAPRWCSTDVKQTGVTIKYPASEGYVKYNYSNREDKIEIHFTGTSGQTDLQVLLGPQDTVSKVEIDDLIVNHNLLKIKDSRYIQYLVNGAGTHKVIIYKLQ